MSKHKKSIAFICVHNSCRSQIAEALAKHTLDGYDIYSAGTEIKSAINPDAVRLMKEQYQIDMEEMQYPKVISEIPSHINYVITMGCGVTCPIISCDELIDWGLEDPTGQDDVSFIKVMKRIEQNIEAFKLSKG